MLIAGLSLNTSLNGLVVLFCPYVEGLASCWHTVFTLTKDTLYVPSSMFHLREEFGVALKADLQVGTVVRQ